MYGETKRKDDKNDKNTTITRYTDTVPYHDVLKTRVQNFKPGARQDVPARAELHQDRRAPRGFGNNVQDVNDINHINHIAVMVDHGDPWGHLVR